MTRRSQTTAVSAIQFGAFFVLGCVVALSVVSIAHATSLFSGNKSFSSNGTNYQNQASISDTTPATTVYVDRISAGNTAVSRMGTRPRAYLQDGTACFIGNTSFNTYATRTWYSSGNFAEGNCSGYYYGKGATETWNGSGFNFESTNQTPVVN